MRNVLHKLLGACIAMSVALGCVTSTMADGKLYMRERVPPGVPYQRAIIMHDAGKQTMVLQTAFMPRDGAKGASVRNATPRAATEGARTAGGGKDGAAMKSTENGAADAPLGWVVPLPSVPDLSSLPKNGERSIFLGLDMMTAPRVTRISTVLLMTAVFAPIAALLAYVIVGMTSWFVPTWRTLLLRWIPPRHLVPVAVAFVIPVLLLPSLGSARSHSGIEVLKSEEIGVFDAKVIKADASDQLIAWLNEHGFAFTPGDRPVLDDYVRNDWCFVVALVRDDERNNVEMNSDRLIDPLIMRFNADAPIYPLALTSTVGSDTEILLYLLSDVRRDCRGRLPLRRARPMDDGIKPLVEDLLLDLDSGTDPQARGFTWLAKFKGTMTPAEMRHDLTFTPSSDAAPYREHIVRW